MIYTISTPPGRSTAFTFQDSLAGSGFAPLLAPPFDDGNGLQSNARITSYSGKAGSPPETQIGLGFLLGSDPGSLSQARATSPVMSEDEPFLQYPPLFSDSPRSPAENALSPYEALHLRRSPPALENGSRVVDADLNASSSAFSIRDWIINPSSSPDPLDPLCGSSTALLNFGSAPGALSQPSGTLNDVETLNMAFTVSPGTSVGINPAVLSAPRIRSPLTDKNGSHGSMETAFLQVVERICFSRIPITTSLSPSQTLIPRKDYALSPVSELPNVLHSAGTLTGSNCGMNSGSLSATPKEASRELVSNNFLTLGSTFVSPQSTLSSNGYTKCPLVSPETPVFNVHEGISEHDLQRRANRYRRRYPGRSLDRHWLLKYAGKLNKDGKAIEDYRCYITGCAQVNKRRDHIIVHICSHVNERPFACRYWLLRFRSFSLSKR